MRKNLRVLLKVLLLILLSGELLPVDAKSFECMIEPSQIIELRAPIEGLIDKILVDRGDIVKQGQVLITLDMDVDKARFEQARFKAGMKGNQLAARSRLDYSSKKYARNQELFQDQYVSANDKDESESTKNLAAAELQEARDNSQVAELQVREYEEMMRLKTLRSPFDGVVMERSHHPGEVAQSNDRLAILKLARTHPLYIEVVLPAMALGKLKIGDEILVKPNLEGLGEFKAKIKVVDPIVDAASSTLRIRLEVANRDQRITAGLGCQADIPVLQ